jgi:hypothetical protein
MGCRRDRGRWGGALAVAAPLLALACGGRPAAPPLVLISELMYHPVDEQSPQEHHEFVELQNRGETSVDLGGWRLADGIRYTFPAGTQLAPGGFLVVARSRTHLLALARYALASAQVVGDYQGELDNDGERVVLLDDRGVVADDVSYDDDFPWPLGADALGGGEGWLAADKLDGKPLAEHRHLGRSLERVSFRVSPSPAGAWEASPLDGASPGRPPALPDTRPAAVASLQASAMGGGSGPRIAAADAARIAVGFFAEARPQAPEVEFFVDGIEVSDEPTTRVALLHTRIGDGYEAVLPPQKERSIVRYRVVDTRDGQTTVVSPRPSDPFDWHAYFVSPADEGQTPAYHLFIKTADWERMFDHIEQGRVPGHVGTLGGRPGFCAPNPYWNARVPATLVVGGQVHDVQVRYQGSGTNRTGATRLIDPRVWPMDVTPPARPSPFRALSWRVNFPRYARLDSKAAINLNKLTDGTCMGFSYAVGIALFEQAGIPAGQKPHYVRFFVNGAYYNYMQRMERVDEELIRRFYGPRHDMGDLFKSTGIRWEQGPFGWGDERLLEDHCGYSAAQRYDTTYNRESLTGWKRGSAEVKKLIEDLHAARASGVPALRRFFEDSFDLPQLTTYMAIRNWLAPWDDYFHNHYLYRRADGRWLLIPNDFDGEMGFSPLSTPDTSFFNGRENDRSNRNNWMNYLKDAYLRSFREEFLARLKELSQTVLHPANVTALIDEAAADYAAEEAKQAPNALMSPIPLCSPIGDEPAAVERMKDFARRRHERLLDGFFD